MILMGRGKNEWQERGYVLRQFHEREGKAVRSYRRFMEEGKDQGRRPELVGGGIDTEFRGVVPGIAFRGFSGDDRT
jgi:hypothetical protein